MDALRKYVDGYFQRTGANQRLEHQGVAFLFLGSACMVVALTLLSR
jgi:hypothetical protein